MNLVTMAFLGDAVYELKVRCVLAERQGALTADRLHHEAVKYVKASAQAKAMKYLRDKGILSETESDLVRRARNRKPKSIPKNADPVEYKLATAFEALLGFLYTEGNTDRVEKLSEIAMGVIDE